MFKLSFKVALFVLLLRSPSSAQTTAILNSGVEITGKIEGAVLLSSLDQTKQTIGLIDVYDKGFEAY